MRVRQWAPPNRLGSSTRTSPHPGRATDLAYAFEYAVPLDDDTSEQTGHHFTEVPDRCARLEIFAGAYRLTSTVGLADDVIARRHLTIAHVHELA